jgi:hypothetical protein
MTGREAEGEDMAKSLSGCAAVSGRICVGQDLAAKNSGMGHGNMTRRAQRARHQEQAISMVRFVMAPTLAEQA